MEKFRAYRIHGEGGKTLARFDTMVLGTAGYAAALAIHLMEQNDLRPGDGKVLAIDMLAGLLRTMEQNRGESRGDGWW